MLMFAEDVHQVQLEILSALQQMLFYHIVTMLLIPVWNVKSIHSVVVLPLSVYLISVEVVLQELLVMLNVLLLILPLLTV